MRKSLLLTILTLFFLASCRLSVADSSGTQATPTLNPYSPVLASPAYLGMPAPNSNPVLSNRLGMSLKIERFGGNYSAGVDPSQPIRIMQLTDIHFDSDAQENNKTKDLISTMVSRFRPDLVVVTGDLVWTLYNLAGTMGYLQDSVKFMNDLCLANNCYWAYVL
ncbi:MAG TPA: hypothetical protein V6C82_00590, partial [Chroococcales cyanobacterium]